MVSFLDLNLVVAGEQQHDFFLKNWISLFSVEQHVFKVHVMSRDLFVTEWNVAQSIKNCQVLKAGVTCLASFVTVLSYFCLVCFWFKGLSYSLEMIGTGEIRAEKSFYISITRLEVKKNRSSGKGGKKKKAAVCKDISQIKCCNRSLRVR